MSTDQQYRIVDTENEIEGPGHIRCPSCASLLLIDVQEYDKNTGIITRVGFHIYCLDDRNNANLASVYGSALRADDCDRRGILWIWAEQAIYRWLLENVRVNVGLDQLLVACDTCGADTTYLCSICTEGLCEAKIGYQPILSDCYIAHMRDVHGRA